MRPIAITWALLWLHAVGAATARAQADGSTAVNVGLLLQDAWYHEVALNDPEEAARLYDGVLALADLEPRDAATAHLRKGICRQLQGRLEEAEREFQTVLDRYPGEADAGRIARRYLNVESERQPARLLPPETLVYLEFVDLGEQVGFLSELLRSTPLENPVDYYLARGGDDAADASELPPPRDQRLAGLRALLNLGFLKEFQKIAGLALSFTSLEPDDTRFVGVFQPGASNLSRGLIKAILTFAIEEIEERVEGMSVFRMQQAEEDAGGPPFLIAMDSEEEVVFFGNSLGLMRDAVRRYRAPGERPSLADSADFRRALDARAGSVVFAYFKSEPVLRALSAHLEPRDRARVALLTALLGVEDLRAPSLTYARSGDSFRFALRGRVSESSRAAWDVVRTPVLDLELLRLVPREPLLVLAASPHPMDRRLVGLHELVSVRFPQLASSAPPLLVELVRSSLSDADAGDAEPSDDAEQRERRARIRRMLSSMRDLAIVQPKLDGLPRDRGFYVVLGFEDDKGTSDAVAADVEATLGDLLAAVFMNRASRTFRDGDRELLLAGVAARPRLVEPVPGLVLGYAHAELESNGSRRRVLVIAPSADTLGRVFDPERAGELGFPHEGVPIAASKILAVRAAEFVEAFPADGESRSKDPFTALLRRTPTVLLHTLESTSGLSFELTVPEAAVALRRLLRALPTQEAR